MNSALALYKLKRLLREQEPKDADSMDGFLAALAITIILGLGLYVAGVMILLFAGRP